MRHLFGVKRVFLVVITLLVSCTGSKQDFCKYLSLSEAQVFDQTISNTEMRQTEFVLYCVYKDGSLDRLLVTLDRRMKSSVKKFFKVFAQNSPEKYNEIISLSVSGTDSAALFLGNGKELKLNFLIAQNSKHSVILRAIDVISTQDDKIDALDAIAKKVLSRM